MEAQKGRRILVRGNFFDRICPLERFGTTTDCE
jgi:hypothetical protein